MRVHSVFLLSIVSMLLGLNTASAADFAYYVPVGVSHDGHRVEVYVPRTFRAHDGLAGQALVDATLNELKKQFSDAQAFAVTLRGQQATVSFKDATASGKPAISDRAAGALYHTLSAAGVRSMTLAGRPVTADHFSRGAALIVLPFTAVMPPKRLNYGWVRVGASVIDAQTFYKRLNTGDPEIRKAASGLLASGSPAIKISLLRAVRLFKFFDLAKVITPRLTDRDAGVRIAALTAVKGTRNKDILKVLETVVSRDANSDAKIMAVRILVAAGESKYKRYLLLEKLKSNDPKVVLKASKGLIEANDPTFGGAFAALLLNSDGQVREAGLKGLIHYKAFPAMAEVLANAKLDGSIAERVAKHLSDNADKAPRVKGIQWLVAKGTKLGALHGAKIAGEKRVAGTTSSLASALKRPEPRVRLASAEALSLLRDPAGLEPLAVAIRSAKDIKERESLERAAIKIVEAQTLNQAIAISKSVDTTVRQMAIKSLASKVNEHKDKVVGTLKMRMRDSSVEIRRAAVYALARIKDDQVARDLLEVANDADPGVRAEIAFAVANSTLKGAPAILVKMMSDSHKLVKRAAVMGLRIKKVTQALPKLKMLSKIRYPAVRFEVWRAIASMSKKGDPADFDMWSTDALYDKSPDIRVLAIEMLSAYPSDQRTAGAIGAAVIDTSVKVKVAALKMLSVLKHPNAGMEAARALFDEDKEVKLEALTAIEKLKQPAVKGRLKEFLQKEKDAELQQRGKAVLAAL